uniref:(California timema) hypothetical protein n=1 Tax=Timema californicum TaxID=61474 RepID=A0A7R9J6H8_TIMCA|nr:unnamed protein product [Timema californicum]
MRFTRPRFRASISPSSAVELNTTSALANYATEADAVEISRTCRRVLGIACGENSSGFYIQMAFNAPFYETASSDEKHTTRMDPPFTARHWQH